LVDLAQGLSDPQEREAALAMARKESGMRIRLPRSLRPAQILAGLACRAVGRGGVEMLSGPADMLAALRLGMLGR
jgi:phytoene synthase